MATTCELIASNVLGTAAASVSFTGIPGTHTDLLLVISARTSTTGHVIENIGLQFNSSSSGYSWRSVYGLSGSAASESASSQTQLQRLYATTADCTANTFGNCEMYVPNYAGAANKSVSISSVTESNVANGPIIMAAAGLWANTSAITAINLVTVFGANFVSGSSFFLYGITKA
jgi:hypothetical protein